MVIYNVSSTVDCDEKDGYSHQMLCNYLIYLLQ